MTNPKRKSIMLDTMFIFLRLLLAHFIGDFPLQFGKIYKLKHKGLKGVVPHSVIIAGLFILLSWPYLKLPGLWVFIFFVSIIHLFQDWLKIVWTKDPKEGFWSYLFDQFLHITVIAAVLLTGLESLKPPEHAMGSVVSFYNNDTIIVFLIFLIVATYNGTYLIKAFKNTFLGMGRKYTSFEKWYGILERAITASIFIPAGFFIILIPFIFFGRIPVYKVALKYRFNLGKEFASLLEISLSAAIALAAGITFYVISRFL